MLDPPSRMSAYLLGYSTPVNYEDHEMNCGGRAVQWTQNGGKCGICGDPWSGPRRYERPDGVMVQHNIIPKAYRENDVIVITIQITQNHLGWNEFRICNIARSGGVEATQSCLDENVLADLSGKKRFYFDVAAIGFYNYTLVLPAGFTCDHCLLQWKWHCGNDWGCDSDGTCGLGRGLVQEEFYACADVAVAPKGVVIVTQTPPTIAPTTASTTTTTSTTTARPTTRSPDVTTTQPASTTSSTTRTSTPTTSTSTTSTTTRSRSTSASVEQTYNHQDLIDYIKNNHESITSGTHLVYVNPATNNINSLDYFNMVLGLPNKYDPHYTYPNSYVTPAPTFSPSNEDKNAIARLCFACYGNCRFESCYTSCPSICPVKKYK
ncbi:bypass of stop codon protein 1 [Biomphalaria pfeifferi]|uniref:Bypass of stop codon protein 1 n=1 Tax=Biomphalaria pfeifferi TaxID=112525 RepID=A0AAD8FK38_BIOPF|nr:bypass of stop codon protein 1 [Biomphalaria pfeifferi]